MSPMMGTGPANGDSIPDASCLGTYSARQIGQDSES